MNRFDALRSWAPAAYLLPAYLLLWHTNDQILSLLAAGTLVLVLWVVQAVGEGGLHYRQNGLARAWIAWLALLGINTVTSTAPYTSAIYVAILGVGALAFFGWTWQTQAWTVEQQDLAWKRLRWGLYALVPVLFGWAAYQYVEWEHIGMSLAGLRPYGPLMDTNSFSAWMNLLFFPALLLWLESRPENERWARLAFWGGWALLALILITDFSTDSRGGLLSWLCTWPWVLWLYWKRPGYGRRIGLVLGMALLIFLGFQVSRGFDLVHHLAPSFIDHNTSTVSRWLMWKATWTMYLQHPWLGSGFGSYFLWYPHFRSVHELGSAGTYAHNDYLQFLMEGGPLALAFLLALAGGLFLGLFRTIRALRNQASSLSADSLRKAEAVGLLLGVFAITGHALGNFIFYNTPLGLLTGLFLARAWQVWRPRPLVALSSAGVLWRTAVFSLLSVAGVLGLLLLLLSSTLASRHWVEQYLPKNAQIPVLVKANALLRVIDPWNPGPWVLGAALDLEAGHLWQQHGQTVNARIAYLHAYGKEAHALAGIPEDAPVYYTQGMILARYGAFLGIPQSRLVPEVSQHWRKAIYFDPSNPMYRWELANWYARHGAPAKGLKVLEGAYRHPILYAQQRPMVREMLQQYRKTWTAKLPAPAPAPGARPEAPAAGAAAIPHAR